LPNHESLERQLVSHSPQETTLTLATPIRISQHDPYSRASLFSLLALFSLFSPLLIRIPSSATSTSA